MREIKFDFVVRNLKFNEVHHEVYTLEQLWSNHGINTWIRSSNAEFIARREWTGLTDKNGKEIWESDLVRYQDRVMEVRWSSKLARFFLTNDQQGRDFNDLVALECEVIGSIFEQPELMGATK